MTSDQRDVTVVYPGRRVGGPGPDFRDAILAFPDGQILRGDIEIHVRAADWTAHGHHRDPAYNGVVLHVVGEGPAVSVRRHDGAATPTVVVASTEAPPPAPVAIVCPPTDREAAARALDDAGDRWWRERSTRVAAAIDATDPDTAAWTLLLDAAGYGGNQ
ncbi:MAG: DUF2851 family protein, partial [Dehalococcoidia bacterium]|nr:DUF2851 family protein [Dehalococcoidia bacterium]